MVRWKERGRDAFLVALGVLATMGWYERRTIQSTVSNLATTIQQVFSAPPPNMQAAKEANHSVPDAKIAPVRGGLVDEIFKHPELQTLAPFEYKKDGTWIKFEKTYGYDFFRKPREVFRIGQPKESPVDMRIRVEEQLTRHELDKEKIRNYFDNVSNLTGFVLKEELKTGSVEEANRQASDEQFFRAVAKAFRVGNAAYKSEEQYMRSFSADLHHGRNVHFDCNMLVEGMLHVAANYARIAWAELAQGHMYLRTPTIAVEATHFREKIMRREVINGVHWKIITHTDHADTHLIEEPLFHFKQFAMRINYVANNALLKQEQEEQGRFKRLSQEELEEVITGSMYANLFHHAEEKNDKKRMEELARNYVDFSTTAENVWAVNMGFNVLVSLAEKEWEQWVKNKGGRVSLFEQYLQSMKNFSANHETLREKAKHNITLMTHQLDYARNPTSLDKALEMYAGERDEAFYQAKSLITRIHQQDPELISALPAMDEFDIYLRVTLAGNYAQFLRKNNSPHVQPIKAQLEEYMNKIIDITDEDLRKAHMADDTREKIVKNLKNIRDGKSYWASGLYIVGGLRIRTQNMMNLRAVYRHLE